MIGNTPVTLSEGLKEKKGLRFLKYKGLDGGEGVEGLHFQPNIRDLYCFTFNNRIYNDSTGESFRNFDKTKTELQPSTLFRPICN